MQKYDWEKIVKENASIVWQSAYRLLGNSADAQECFQNTFISALELSRSQRVKNFQALLVHISTRRAIDILRRRHNRLKMHNSSVDLENLPLSRPGPEELLEAEEARERLRQALSKLPSRQAEVFCMRNLNDMSLKEIGNLVGLPANNVGVLLHRAKIGLREILKSYDETSEVHYEKRRKF